MEGAVYGKGTKGKKIYPNMKPKQDNPKKIYVLKERPYHKTFILTQQVKDEIIRRKFIGPKIYSTQEYIQAYNGYK
ncbi:hypothetical protein CGC56_08250 [Capnocytophaga canimorsus]|uniref:Immunity protein 43 domain-containing protein n=1 Tax=Capnocytophaga canimorsus TaxID=28188 RepID=A0A250G484_9FLAO|nr:hypothetical protein CGC56_08250 [Capnocytophaga canimorsus]